MNEKEIRDLAAQADTEYEKVLGLPHETRQVIRRLTDTVEEDRRHIRSLAKWVGVPEDAPSIDIFCEVSAALEQASTAAAAAGTDMREHLHAKCDCVPNLGPAHCHLCSNQQGSPVPWHKCSAVREAIADDKNGARR